MSKANLRARALVITILAALIVSMTNRVAVAQDDKAAITQIDTDCTAIQNAIMALHPIHVAQVSGTWKVLSDADYAVAEQTKASVALLDVYKQGKSYAWISGHSVDSNGKQTAVKLCYRQDNGSLARAKQAATVPALDAAAAQLAYYGPDGKVIQKTTLFEENDPLVAKKISDLPFFKQLP
jgi:hypothetical protein